MYGVDKKNKFQAGKKNSSIMHSMNNSGENNHRHQHQLDSHQEKYQLTRKDTIERNGRQTIKRRFNKQI